MLAFFICCGIVCALAAIQERADRMRSLGFWLGAGVFVLLSVGAAYTK